jgi:hypothetical protein
VSSLFPTPFHMLAFMLLLLGLGVLVSAVTVSPAVADVSAVAMLLPESHTVMAPCRCQPSLLSSIGFCDGPAFLASVFSLAYLCC